jgi:hypothetical protein
MHVAPMSLSSLEWQWISQSSSSSERPIHYKEQVLDVVLQWTDWAEEIKKENYICLKRNYVLDKIRLVVVH